MSADVFKGLVHFDAVRNMIRQWIAKNISDTFSHEHMTNRECFTNDISVTIWSKKKITVGQI